MLPPSEKGGAIGDGGEIQQTTPQLRCLIGK